MGEERGTMSRKRRVKGCRDGSGKKGREMNERQKKESGQTLANNGPQGKFMKIYS